MIEIPEKDGRLLAQGADNVGGCSPALVDQRPGALLGVLLGTFPRAEQLLGHLLGPCRCHAHEGGGRLAAALQLIFCSHTRSVGPPGEARPVRGPVAARRAPAGPW